MIELIQFPWSPFCLVQRRILEYAGVPFKKTNIHNQDRSLVWRLTRRRYYGVPIIRDGRAVVFETDDHSQVIAKYIDGKYQLNLFPRTFRGVDRILWRFIKERKFGRGCLDQWRTRQHELITDLTQVLVPFELMLAGRPFLLQEQPHFIDFDLWGMLANFLFTGHYQLPALHSCLNEWFARMSKLKPAAAQSEKLHS